MPSAPAVYARVNTFFSRFLLFLIVTFLGVSVARAQTPHPKWEFGFHISEYIYQGDLAPSGAGSYKTPGFGAGIYANRLLSPSLALRTSLDYGKLKGDDARYPGQAWRLSRNLNFKTSAFELSEMVVWNLLGNNFDAYRPGLTPYLFGGIGVAFVDVKRDFSKFDPHAFITDSAVINGLAADQRHALPDVIPVIPIGAGLRFGISPSLALTAEVCYRITFTDYLDGYSQAGNPNHDDRYYTYSIGLVYKIFSGDVLRCPVIKL